jgi:hypothetical protein
VKQTIVDEIHAAHCDQFHSFIAEPNDVADKGKELQIFVLVPEYVNPAVVHELRRDYPSLRFLVCRASDAGYDSVETIRLQPPDNPDELLKAYQNCWSLSVNAG